MSTAILCPKCQKKLAFKSDPSGKKIKCPSCSAVFEVRGKPAPKPSARTIPNTISRDAGRSVSQPAQNKPGVSQVDGPLGGMASSNPELFPPEETTKQVRPLGHAIADPGFAPIDIHAIRSRQDEDTALFENRAAASPYSAPKFSSAYNETASTQAWGIAGVLIVIGILLVLGAMVTGLQTVEAVLRLAGTQIPEMMDKFSGVDSAAMQKAGAIITFNAITCVLRLCVTLVALILFFKKSKHFPKVYVGRLALNLCVLFAGILLIVILFPDLLVFSVILIIEIVIALAMAGVFVPYMLMSQRVKNTFVH